MSTIRIRTVVTTLLGAVALAVAAGCSGPAASQAGTAATNQSIGGDADGSGAVPNAPVASDGVQPLAAQVTAPSSGESVPGTPAGSSATTNGQRAVTVTATGTVSGTPDTLTVQLGVQTRADNASKALQDNNSAANAVIDRLRKAGVADRDLQTSQLSIDPTYTSNGSTITGYQVTNSVTATLHDIGKAGALIDAAQQAAGNAIRIDGISFSIADDSALRAKARAAAVKQALAQAKQIADAAGVTLGPVLSIVENPQDSSPQPVYATGMAAGSAATSVLPGSQDLTDTVQLVVAIG
jgi:uncharacterized protein YggE